MEEDPGIYDTWNMGIKMATGEFVTNVNCDDRRPEWAYEKQAKFHFIKYCSIYRVDGRRQNNAW